MDIIKQGQVWINRAGASVTIRRIHTDRPLYPIEDSEGLRYTSKGTLFLETDSAADLVELMGGAPCLQDPGKRNQLKFPIHLVPPEWILWLGHCFRSGQVKYPEGSWMEYTKAEEVMASAERHILRWRLGEDWDQEDGTHHCVKAAWNLLCIAFQQYKGKMVYRGKKVTLDYHKPIIEES